jgi:uncharacterized membrane protein
MNPFSIREALLAKHAQHVVLIHFPIALFFAGVFFDLAARWTKRSTFAAAAYYNFLLAAISTPAVVATGLLAWQLQLDGQTLRGILLQHLVVGVTASAMICLVWYAHYRSRRAPVGKLPAYLLPMELVAAGVLGIAAHLGGYLSGVNIPG